MFSLGRTSRLFFGSDGFLNRGHTVTAEPQANEVEQWTGDQPNTRKDRRRLMSGALLQSGIHARGGRDERGRRPSSLPDLGRVDVSEAIPDTFCGPSLLRADFFCARLTAFSLAPQSRSVGGPIGASFRKTVSSLDVRSKTQPTVRGFHKGLSQIGIRCLRGHRQAALGILAEFFGIARHVMPPTQSPRAWN